MKRDSSKTEEIKRPPRGLFGSLLKHLEKAKTRLESDKDIVCWVILINFLVAKARISGLKSIITANKGHINTC